MAFDSLSEKLGAVFKRLRSRGKLSEADVKEVMREVRMALLEADVNYKVAKDFTAKVSEKCIGAGVLESLTPAQTVIKTVNEELTELMGTTDTKINLAAHPPTVIMMCGLQGAGKTTHSAKLAKYFKKQGRRPLLVACDVYRPAAITQLQIMGERVDTPVFEMGTENPVKIAQAAVKHARDFGFDIVILDTAGRLHVDEKLMQELRDIREKVQPNEILLVVDSMAGQDAVNAAKSFNESLEIDGVILTKLDSDTRGGAALSVRAVTGKPIKFVGMGEKVDDLEAFHPERMASRILGMGDVLTLIEKAQTELDQKKAEKLAERMQENKFDLNDLLDQMRQIQKMGSIQSLISMIPGMSGKIKEEDIDESGLTRTEAIILSMTPRERAHPQILQASRKRRIAAGSGTRVEDVNALLKQFEQMQKMMKQFTGKGKKRRGMRGLPPGFPNL